MGKQSAEIVERCLAAFRDASPFDDDKVIAREAREAAQEVATRMGRSFEFDADTLAILHNCGLDKETYLASLSDDDRIEIEIARVVDEARGGQETEAEKIDRIARRGGTR